MALVIYSEPKQERNLRNRAKPSESIESHITIIF